MLADNAELRSQLERSTGEEAGSGGSAPHSEGGETQRLNDQIVNLQKLMDGQVHFTYYSFFYWSPLTCFVYL